MSIVAKAAEDCRTPKRKRGGEAFGVRQSPGAFPCPLALPKPKRQRTAALQNASVWRSFWSAPALSALALVSILNSSGYAAVPADLVIREAKVITVDPRFSLAEAVSISGDKIIAVGNSQEIARFIGANTRVIEAKGKTVMPGLYDSHVHSYRASISEFAAPMPVLN